MNLKVLMSRNPWRAKNCSADCSAPAPQRSSSSAAAAAEASAGPPLTGHEVCPSARGGSATANLETHRQTAPVLPRQLEPMSDLALDWPRDGLLHPPPPARGVGDLHVGASPAQPAVRSGAKLIHASGVQNLTHVQWM
eukprot:CAMPEP_0177245120 /NCGR_PEP_ID=MMETSP0367-20130122/50282_1 /TAXON_ID=447022 ORGANISM="Scrippsiella hangoei-like, Strain SHHI-4" /NCGR_SAMPLE_ID=MMETSP0367 /ASSEMBLY_ACC=CAM_ASM_000362 /LENGTH=137 /DNA_ID=CAMNT_0018697003 /DNA_START=335 /DNA_END=749 /DNA_ORIENTATION=+